MKHFWAWILNQRSLVQFFFFWVKYGLSTLIHDWLWHCRHGMDQYQMRIILTLKWLWKDILLLNWSWCAWLQQSWECFNQWNCSFKNYEFWYWMCSPWRRISWSKEGSCHLNCQHLQKAWRHWTFCLKNLLLEILCSNSRSRSYVFW